MGGACRALIVALALAPLAGCPIVTRVPSPPPMGLDFVDPDGPPEGGSTVSSFRRMGQDAFFTRASSQGGTLELGGPPGVSLVLSGDTRYPISAWRVGMRGRVGSKLWFGFGATPVFHGEWDIMSIALDTEVGTSGTAGPVTFSAGIRLVTSYPIFENNLTVVEYLWVMPSAGLSVRLHPDFPFEPFLQISTVTGRELEDPDATWKDPGSRWSAQFGLRGTFEPLPTLSELRSKMRRRPRPPRGAPSAPQPSPLPSE